MKKLIITLYMLLFFAVSALAAININTADQSTLESITGIGPAKAKAIIEYRNQHQFKTVDELTQIKGIGTKTLEKIRDQISVSD